jgi:hypothetical protein
MKKYWLRGAITGSIIILLNYLLIGPFGPLGFLFSLPWYLLEKIYFLSFPPSSVEFISYILTGFACGAVIGWIYGKIRNRKQVGTTME